MLGEYRYVSGEWSGLQPVLLVRIGFNAGPDPAFYLKADLDPGGQTNADPDQDPGLTF